MDDYNDKFLEYLFKTNSMIELWNERENILNGVAYHYTKYENIKKILSPEDPVFLVYAVSMFG